MDKIKAITFPPADFSASQWEYEHMIFRKSTSQIIPLLFFASPKVFSESSFLHLELRLSSQVWLNYEDSLHECSCL